MSETNINDGIEDNIILKEPDPTIIVPLVEESTLLESELVEAREENYELAKEVVEFNEALEKTDANIETIQNNIDGLEAMFNEGKYCQSLATIVYNRSLELHEQIGGNNASIVLGAESFSDSTTARLCMQAGLEGMGETIKKYASNTIEFIKKVIEKIVKFIKSIFGTANKLSLISKNYRKLLNNGIKLKTKVDKNDWLQYFKLDNNGSIDFTPINALFKDYEELLSPFHSFYKNMVQDAEKPIDEFLNVLKTYIKAQSEKRKQVIKSTLKLDVGARFNEYYNQTMMVNFFDGEIKSPEDVKKFFRSFTIGFYKISLSKDDDKNSVSETKVDKSDLLKILDKVDKLIESTIATDKKYNLENDKLYKALSNVKKLEKKEGEKDDIVKLKIISGIYQFISYNLERYISFHNSITNYALRFVKAHFDEKVSEPK